MLPGKEEMKDGLYGLADTYTFHIGGSATADNDAICITEPCLLILASGYEECCKSKLLLCSETESAFSALIYSWVVCPCSAVSSGDCSMMSHL